MLKNLIEEEHRAITQLLDSLNQSELEIKISDRQNIRDRLRHMTRSEFTMAQSVSPPEEPVEFTVDRNATIETLRKKFEESKERHIQTVLDLQNVRWDETWKSTSSGKTYTYGFLFWHFLEHLATHRGQIDMALRQAKED